MREVCSRIGSRIWFDAHSFSVALICAALIGRRVFLFAATIAVAAHMLRRKDARPAEEPPASELALPPLPVIIRLREPVFQPPREMILPPPPDVSHLRAALERAIIAQRELIEALMTGVIADGHVLLEGAPGLGKTLACMTVARASGASFSRIQCNADITPADIVGCEIFDQRDRSFKTRLGPIFANVVLVDEINRAPARAQAATLEAMEERGVTIGAAKYALPDPFLVLATMNEAETDGVFPLPAAQLDRFLLKTVLEFPSEEEELAIVERCAPAARMSCEATVDTETVRTWQAAAGAAYCAPRLKRYIVEVVRATRDAAKSGQLEMGAGPRAGLAILRASRARAMLAGRNYVLPGDIQSVALSALCHRIRFAHAYTLSRQEREDRLRAIRDAVPLP
jgi:MoxR-like ATPase